MSGLRFLWALMSHKKLHLVYQKRLKFHKCEPTYILYFCLVIDWMNRLMAPCTPFLTEHLYQNLRRLKAPHPQDGSIHFQMMPEVNEDVIKVEIERAVGNMTNVIQLGRTIRDRKTVPEKYPLPEIVVIRLGDN